MRNNIPVTSIERQLDDGKFVVSKTDTKGKITYVNVYFTEISGFAENELIGSPHNLVRHPDMPPEAFGDMWDTLKAGIPWTGLVKNRCKNGDYYWVRANVTPVQDGDTTVGYMSVRSKPTREQIEAAEQLYLKFRNSNARGLAIHRGAVVRTSWLAKLSAMRHMNLSTRIGLNLGLIGLMILGAGAIGFSSHLAGNALYGFSGMIGLSFAMSLYVWHSLHANLVEPLKLALQAARAIAGGDLCMTFDYAKQDDMGQLLKAMQQMTVNLQATISDVHSSVETITTATKEIASGNMDLSDRTESEASSLAETASSMDEFASTVKQNSENAIQANKFADAAAAVAVEGGAVVAKVVVTMDEISSSAKRIADIIGLIDSIAFQTNILALNAAVEAARAGDQGRGFAVVATEVRNLAQRSAGAAKEIKGLIDESVHKVNLGSELVHQAGKTMEQVVTSVLRVTTIMGEIARASNEQNSGIDQVNRAVADMDAATQQNAALVEQAAAASASLEEQTEKLLQTVSVFRLNRNTGIRGASAAKMYKATRLPLAQKEFRRVATPKQLNAA